MRKLVLVKLMNCRGIDEVLDIKFVEVGSYSDLIEFVKNNLIKDYDSWMEYMKEWWSGDSEEDIIENLLEGKFEDKWFNLMIEEEVGVLCIEEEFYNEVRKEKSNIELFDMFLEEMYE